MRLIVVNRLSLALLVFFVFSIVIVYASRCSLCVILEDSLILLPSMLLIRLGRLLGLSCTMSLAVFLEEADSVSEFGTVGIRSESVCVVLLELVLHSTDVALSFGVALTRKE